MRSTRSVASRGVRLLILVLLFPASARAMSEQEMCDRYLRVVEDAVTVFEPIFVDDSENIPNSGYYNFSQYDNWGPEWYAAEITVPGSGMVVFCYSVLLNETDKETFTDQKIPRATLLDHAIKVIRWCCLTSDYVDKPHPFPIPHGYKQRIRNGSWIRPPGHRTDVMGWLTVGTFRLWDQLDDETKKLVEQLMIGTAMPDRQLHFWAPGGQGGNHDIIKQNMASTIGATFMFPHRDDAAKYLDITRGSGIDMTATLHDKACRAVADGKPIAEWSRGWNLFQDYSSDHHGWAQVWYGGDLLFEGRYYIELMSRQACIPVPEVFTYEGNGFDGVLEWHKRLCLPEGEPASVHGMEYDAYYGSGLLAYCYGATVKKDPVSAALEEQAAGLHERYTQAVRLYDYHRNSWAKAAAAYLMHKYNGPRAEPLPLKDAWRKLNGAYHHRYQMNLVHRADDKWASFSWGSFSGRREGVLCGYVVPTRGLSATPEPLIYLHPQSLIGQVTLTKDGKPIKQPVAETSYQHLATDLGFSTAGVASQPELDRYYAFWSFDDGPCVMLSMFKAKKPCELSWSGLPVYFYARPGLTKSRSYSDAQGTQPLEQSAGRESDWWCVNDVLGLAAAGGNGRVKVERSVGNNWARTEAYRDKCDGVFVSPVKDESLAAGDVPVNLATVIYPHPTPEQMAVASEALAKPALGLPDGWRGLVVPDRTHPGKRYLCVANFHGCCPDAAVSLNFDEGAPILGTPTIINGKEHGNDALAHLRLDQQESLGDTLELYVTVEGSSGITAARTARNLYRLDPADEYPRTVQLRYTGTGGKSLLVQPDSGDGERRFAIDASGEPQAFEVVLNGPVSIKIEGPGYEDCAAPAVEITDARVREDGRVTIDVAAGDHSGVAGVALYCDGQPIGERTERPYKWLHRPGDGAHTYQAVATDASPAGNQRRSFKRTIEVGNRSQW